MHSSGGSVLTCGLRYTEKSVCMQAPCQALQASEQEVPQAALPHPGCGAGYSFRAAPGWLQAVPGPAFGCSVLCAGWLG